MKKILLKITSAAVAFLLLLGALPAYASESSVSLCAAVIADSFYGLDADDFTGEGNITARSISSAVKTKGKYLNRALPFLYDYVHGKADIGETAGKGTDAVYMLAEQMPRAQLLLMKVCGGEPLKPDYDALCAAVDDASAIGVGVILLALGDFGEDDWTDGGERLIKAIRAAYEKGIVVVCPAGDTGIMGAESLWDDNYGLRLPLASMPDYGTLGKLASLAEVFTVASVDTPEYYDYCVSYSTGKAAFTDTTARFDICGGKSFTEHFDGAALQYAVVDGEGSAEDCAAAGLDGKLALIQRGGITFAEKVNNAAACGAVGVIIYNNEEKGALVSMELDGASLPAIFVSREDGAAMAGEKDKTLKVTDGETALFTNPNGGNISECSARGLTSDMSLKPEFAAVGGEVALRSAESTTLNGSSTVYAAAVFTAQLLRFMSEAAKSGRIYGIEELRNAMINGAQPASGKLASGESVYHSPRAQGAGVVTSDTVLAELLLTSDGGKGAIFAGDGLKSSFTMTVRLRNTGKSTAVCSLSVTASVDATERYCEKDGALTPESAASDKAMLTPYFITGTAVALTGASVTVDKKKQNINACSKAFEAAEITIAPGEEKTLTITVTLSAAELKTLTSRFSDGFFVEGYIKAEAKEEMSSIPYYGFIGDYSSSGVFDGSIYGSNAFWGATMLYTKLSDSIMPLGVNTYIGDGAVYPSLCCISPDGDGIGDRLGVIFTLNRDCESVYGEIRDEKGKVITSGTLEGDFVKRDASGSIAVYRYLLWNGRAADNASYVYPDGRYTVILTADPVYGDAQSLEMSFYIDNTPPVLSSYSCENGVLKLTASDGRGVLRVRVYSLTDGGESFSDSKAVEGGSAVSLEFDVSPSESKRLYVEITDFAYNISLYRIDI